jgi:hypothetical protein
MSSFKNYCRQKHKQEPWRVRFDPLKHPAACAKFKAGESLTAEECFSISLKCGVCQRATKKKHLPGCDYPARNEIAWDAKRAKAGALKAKCNIPLRSTPAGAISRFRVFLRTH